MTLLTHLTQQSIDGQFSSETRLQLRNTYLELRRLETDEGLLAFIKAQVGVGIPFQLRALRARFGKQEELAKRAGMRQPRISALEKVGHSSINIETLARLAAAMRVGLIVKFAPVSEMIEWRDSFSPDHFSVPSVESESTAALAAFAQSMSQTSTRTENSAHDMVAKGRGRAPEYSFGSLSKGPPTPLDIETRQ